MNEEKYACIKLVSGEELFAQVEEFVDEDRSLVAFDPCFIKELPVKRGPFALYRVEPWLKISDERMFVFDLKNVLYYGCLLYTSPSPRDCLLSRMPSSA